MIFGILRLLSQAQETLSGSASIWLDIRVNELTPRLTLSGRAFRIRTVKGMYGRYFTALLFPNGNLSLI